jgi:hypothetical protein
LATDVKTDNFNRTGVTGNISSQTGSSKFNISKTETETVDNFIKATEEIVARDKEDKVSNYFRFDPDTATKIS